ncbi:26S proteasome non-ATPase regulatory subunit 10 [Melipona quadrifasciata]|uniref:26S proteasome non-ATPase regulatory subunit 10 n=1 Tax=Melipona quadrifasciata TaxID=166423 RepID=A0A0M8ZQ90_9HYME|nr:26S proteasome non-ATPase regulatory subunit 10 [Melipona quadrifasciata]
MSEHSIYDMAYCGKTTDVKNLLSENEKLKTAKDGNGRMLLHWAALGGHDDLVRFLLSLDVPVDPIDDTDMTPLILAASAGQKDANVNVTDNRGATPLHRAASKGNIAIVNLLIEYGRNLNIDSKDADGNSALHLACEENRVDEAKLLVENGASTTLMNKQKKTPLDLASPGLTQQLKEIKENFLNLEIPDEMVAYSTKNDETLQAIRHN